MVQRILHCNNDNKNMGGAYIFERLLENKIRKYGYIFDWITMDEFIDTGDIQRDVCPDSRTYSAKLRKNRFLGHIKLINYVHTVVKQNRYKIVHLDIDAAWKGLLYAIPSKIAGARVVVHSHAAGVDGDCRALKKMLHLFSCGLLSLLADSKIACSNKAKKWMFPGRNGKDVHIIFDGINLEKKRFDCTERKQTRHRLGIGDNEILLGNIGTLCENKNQKFLVEILKKIVEQGIDAKMIFVGDSYLNYGDKLKKYVSNYGLEKRVIFYGYTNDTNMLLNAMDFFLFPSKSEGLGMSLIEAQATGLDCIASSSIPGETKISSWVYYEDNDDAEKWCDKIIKINERRSIRELRKVDKKYGIEFSAKQMADIYYSLLYKNSKEQ